VRLDVPIIGQLQDTQEVNRYYDCVASSIASCLTYLTQKKYGGAEIKDAVYGTAYVGVTDPEKYITYCQQQHISLKKETGSSSKALLSSAIAHIKNKIPVLLTEDDPYAPNPSLGWTHVVAVCAVDEPSGTLTVMDPYVAKYITQPYEHWISVLRTNAIFTLEHDYTIPQGWRDVGSVLYGPNNVPVRTGFRDWILMHPNWNNADWPLQPEESRNPLELSNPKLGPGTEQLFRMTILEWTEKLGVFEGWPGPEIIALRKKAGI